VSADIWNPYAAGGHADGRLVAPSAERNARSIVDAVGPVLIGRRGLVLEIGAGTGQHCVALADAFPQLDWQPSDPFDVHLDSIRAWVAHSGARNIRAPIWLDAAEEWPKFGPLAGVLAANVIHITPWVVAEGIVRGAAAAPARLLIFYGPFREGGQHTGEGNERFDAALRAEDPAWGVRDIDDVADLAGRAGFGPPEITAMPSNNRLVVFERG
jgi:hypothetical protein